MAKKVWTPAARHAFAAKMKAARAAKHRSRHTNPGRKSIHTAKFDRCVTDVKKSLKHYRRRGNAYAICDAKLGERQSFKAGHRRQNPSRHYSIFASKGNNGPRFRWTGKKFSVRERPAVFATTGDAVAAATVLREHFRKSLDHVAVWVAETDSTAMP